MRVSHLSLSDFRNYATAELALESGPNLIVGRNGQGKTNLVEAIAYFASLRSHRVSSDVPLIRAGADAAIARLRLESGGRVVVLELQLNRDRPNRAQVNGNVVRLRELPRWFSSVAFVPEDLSIVRGEPAGRRRFMDDALIARHPVAAGAIADYERVVRQRTALLKSARSSGARPAVEATLQVWDDQLVSNGVQIMLARRQLARDLASPLAEGYERLVGQDHLPRVSLVETVRAEPPLSTVSRETSAVPSPSDVSRETLAEQFRETLSQVRDREFERGATLVGPHRDDLLLELNGLPVRGYASHGESWSFALSLKMSLANLLRQDSSAGDPVIILDDVFAELDTGRRESLMSAVSDFEQVIVTAAVEEDVPSAPNWNRIEIAGGEVLGGET